MKTIHNRAKFKDSDSLEEKIKKHNENLEKTFKKAQQGEMINLTDLMIDKEELLDEKN